MTIFPCAKINLGLNIVNKREDGYHNLETVFYPIPVCDALEVTEMDHDFPSAFPCDLKISGNSVECNEQENLVVKAYNLLAKDFTLPRIHAHLYKQIPSQAGLGGGSSDAAYMIHILNEYFHLNIGKPEMERYAAKLGADCAFFISAQSAFATGIGEVLTPIETVEHQLKGRYIVLVKPNINVTTKEAFAHIVPQKPAKCCKDIVGQPINTWKDELSNDFEVSVFKKHPELAEIKESLYRLGAQYAQMSGSGSTLFGIFNSALNENEINRLFPNCFTSQIKL
jgi:4-diphosphocytidyl-2-C-methyl-D-erythritol kinase